MRILSIVRNLLLTKTENLLLQRLQADAGALNVSIMYKQLEGVTIVETDINILFYDREKNFMQGITRIFIDNVVPDIKKIYEFMKISNYTKANSLDCECDVSVWMKNNRMYIRNQNNKYEVLVFDNWFFLLKTLEVGIFII